MKIGLLSTAVVAALLTVAFLAMAGERASAASDTSAALEIVENGLDWDETTPITTEQQTERMDANVNVLRSQKSSRNTWGGLGITMLAIAVGSGVMFWKQNQAAPSNSIDSET